MMMKFRAIDLFSGAGGLTQGLRDAGFHVLAGVEFESEAAYTYRENHCKKGKTALYEQDIRKMNPKQMMRDLGIAPGELDLLAGCPPCQGFSSMKSLNGKYEVDDARKDLVNEFVRFVRAFLPKTILMENVPALASDKRMEEVRTAFAELGYVGEPHVLNATAYGVPQRRRRMIFLASRIGSIDYANPISREERRTVRDAIEGLPKAGKSGDPLHDCPEKRTAKVQNIIKMIPKDGGSRSSLGEDFQLECHKRLIGGFKDVYGRMKWDDVSPTITGGCTNPSKGRFIHPSENRAITIREAALLQSFPMDYFFSLRKGKQVASLLVGNAFPPAFVMPHAKMIFDYLKISKRKEFADQ